jgi:hypothetical protein
MYVMDYVGDDDDDDDDAANAPPPAFATTTAAATAAAVGDDIKCKLAGLTISMYSQDGLSLSSSDDDDDDDDVALNASIRSISSPLPTSRYNRIVLDADDDDDEDDDDVKAGSSKSPHASKSAAYCIPQDEDGEVDDGNDNDNGSGKATAPSATASGLCESGRYRDERFDTNNMAMYLADEQHELGRTSRTRPIFLEAHQTKVAWNERWQQILEMPDGTKLERLRKYVTLNHLNTDFIEAVKAYGKTIILELVVSIELCFLLCQWPAAVAVCVCVCVCVCLVSRSRSLSLFAHNLINHQTSIVL